MANLTKTIAVPTTEGNAGASQDCTSMASQGRTFVYVGSAQDNIEIQVSSDNSNWCKLTSIQGSSGIYSCNDRFGYVRCKRITNTSAGVLILMGAEELVATGPAGPTTLGSVGLTGSASTTDATATVVLSFTAGGNGVYSLLAHIVGKKDDGSAYCAEYFALFKKVAGTASAIGVTKVAENTTNLDPGDCTATVTGDLCKLNVVGIAATNITWSGYGTLGTA